MLLRALISRMCQSSQVFGRENEDSGDELARISLEKFPYLHDIILNLLEETHDDSGHLRSEPSDRILTTQKIFVALELIRRRASAIDNDPRILQLVFSQIGNSDWSIREQAAKAYSSQIGQGDRISTVNILLSRDWIDTNTLHGALLTAKYIVRSLILDSPAASNPAPNLISILRTADAHRYEILGNKCPYTAAIFWDIICDLQEHLLRIHNDCE
jgi:hypothetical protein